MKITCSALGRTAKVVLAASVFLTGTAYAGVSTSITSPGVGETVRNFPKPTISVSYASDDPARPLDLATLVITVNGEDWTAKFTRGTASASCALGDTDQLVAGTVTFHASIHDVAGGSADATQTNEVLPSLRELTPRLGGVGETVAVNGVGLDPDPAKNVALFFDALHPTEGVPAAFDAVDPATQTGTVSVPAGAYTGPVFLVVNGKKSPESLVFSIPIPVPNCGSIRELLFMADGGALVVYDPTAEPQDPQCPTANDRYVARVFPDKSMEVLASAYHPAHPLPYTQIAGAVLDKSLREPAVIVQDIDWPARTLVTRVYYKGRWTWIGRSFDDGYLGPGIEVTLPADFDSQGAFYVLYRTAENLNLARVDLGTGARTVIASGLDPLGESWVASLVISCDGFAYVGINYSEPWSSGTPPTYNHYLIRKVDLKTGQVVAQTPVVLNAFLQYQAVSCSTDELWGSVMYDIIAGDMRLVKTAISDSGVGTPATVTEIPRSLDGHISIGPDGTVYLRRYIFVTRWKTILVPVNSAVSACPGSPYGALPYCECPPGLRRGPNQTCEQPPLAILPSTTRWKPQKDATKNIEVNFRGPKGLKPATTLEITDPNGVVLSNQNLTFHPAADPNADPADYSITWAGP